MIYDKIKLLCEKNKISINKLEKEIGLGVGTISKWQSVSPSLSNVQKVASYFDCTIDSLLAIKGKQKGA